MITRYETLNSVYEVDESGSGGVLVRRVSGKMEPTPRLGQDGEWQWAEQVVPQISGLLIIWDAATGKCTWTSHVLSSEPVDTTTP